MDNQVIEMPKSKMTMQDRLELAGVEIVKKYFKRKYDTDGYNMFLVYGEIEIEAPHADRCPDVCKKEFGIDI